MTKKLYIAGSLFSEAEIDKRLKEEEQIKSVIGDVNIYNPINAPCNDKEGNLPTSSDIFWGDTKEILMSDIVVADLSNQLDTGVIAEMGIVWTINYIHRLVEQGVSLDQILNMFPKKKLIPHLSDIRKSTANKYSGHFTPFGYNQFVMGMVTDITDVKDNFNEVLEELKGVR